MSAKCMYHPSKIAHFICPQCHNAYCPDCITRRVVDGYAGKETYYICPKCNELAETVPVGELVEPFWNRLHYFFIYPLNIHPLILILVISFLDFIMPEIRIQFLLYCIIVQYSYAVLTNTAHGRLKPPSLASSVLSGGMVDLIVPAIKQIFLIVLLGFFVMFLVGKLGPMLGGVVGGGLCVLLLPAMIMVLVANNSVVQAINPLMLFLVISRIGWMYLLLLLFLAFTIGAPMSLAGYLVEYISPGLLNFIMVVAAKYYTIMTYNMMGYVLLQYHDEIGFEVDYESFQKQSETPARKKAKKLSPRDQLLEEVALLVRDNEIDEAISLIRRETEGDFKDFVLAERYYKLLKIAKRVDELLAHSCIYLNYLLRRGDKAAAVEVYNDCVALQPDYAPEPEHIKKLAEWMVQAGEVQKGINMLVRFTKTNRDHPLVPEVYLLLARLFREKMKNVKKAKEILNWLLRKYPDHSLRPHVQRYLQTISRPSAAGKG